MYLVLIAPVGRWDFRRMGESCGTRLASALLRKSAPVRDIRNSEQSFAEGRERKSSYMRRRPLAAKRVANEAWGAGRAEGIREAIQKVKAQVNRQNTHAHDGASCLYCEMEEVIRSLEEKNGD